MNSESVIGVVSGIGLKIEIISHLSPGNETSLVLELSRVHAVSIYVVRPNGATSSVPHSYDNFLKINLLIFCFDQRVTRRVVTLTYRVGPKNQYCMLADGIHAQIWRPAIADYAVRNGTKPDRQQYFPIGSLSARAKETTISQYRVFITEKRYVNGSFWRCFYSQHR